MRRWLLLPPYFAIPTAVLVTLLCSLVYSVLRPYLSTQVVALLYLIPVVISAAFWGRLAGISASLLSFFTFLYFFVPPHNTFLVAHPQDFLMMVVLLGVAILVSSLMARIQSNLVETQAREQEAVQLYELSSQLSAKNDMVSVARTLASSIAAIIPFSLVEVDVLNQGNILTVRFPEEVNPEPPSRTFPLESPRGQLGEIRIWNSTEKELPEHERLLQTVIRQGELALDRTNLVDSETRARVLEESDKLKTAILSSVSHELRTPLATIQAAATSLFNPEVELEPDAQTELQSLLLEETERMVQLVGNLLNMSRIEAGALKLQREWNSFVEIVDASVRHLKRAIGEHSILVDVSEDLPLVSVDAVLMEQVMINLLRNSLRFAPGRSPIRIHARTDEQSLLISVSNSGPQIPEEFLSHVFEKFFPIPGKEAVQGTGLGLSICKGIVEAHGGNIWAENLSQGVAFIFTIPLSWEGMMPKTPSGEGEEI